MKKTCVLLSLFAGLPLAKATVFTSAATGDWGNPLSWNVGVGFPNTLAGDSAIIEAGHTLNYDGSIVAAGGNLIVANGNAITINGGTLTQTWVPGAVPPFGTAIAIGATGVVNGAGTLNINTGGTFSSGTSNTVVVGVTVAALGASTGNGTVNLNEGLMLLDAASSAVGGQGLAVGINAGATGVVNVGDATGAADTAVLNLATNNALLTVGGTQGGGAGSGTGTVTIKSDGRLTFGTSSINVGESGGIGTLNLNGGTIAGVGGEINIGRAAGTGNFNMTGGSLTTTGELNFGRDTGSVSSGTISGGTLSVGVINTGRDGSTNAVLSISGGSVTTSGDFRTGQGVGGSGILNVSGTANLISNGEFMIGNGLGTGVVNMTGGNVTVNSWVAIGRDGGTGTLNLSGGTFTKGVGSGTLDIGTFGNGATNASGTLNQTGGSVVNTGSETNIARDASGSGVWNMSGGTATLTTLNIGNAGVGAWNVSNGATATTGSIQIGNGGAGVGTMVVDGATTVVTSTGETRIGNNSVGSMTVRNGAGVYLNGDWSGKIGNNNGSNGTVNLESGGKIFSNNWFVVGSEGGSNGTVNISDLTAAGTRLDASGPEGRFIIGRFGTGVVNQTGGTVKTGNQFLIAFDGSGNGTYNFSGGQIDVSANVEIANFGTGVMNITHGNAAGTTIVRNGGADVVNYFNVGMDTGSKGTLNINLANETDKIVSRELYAGNGAGTVGVINIQKGTLQTNEWVEIGRNGGTGTLNVSGPDAVWDRGTTGAAGLPKDVAFGYNGGTGNLNVSNGGTVKHNWWLNVARGAGSKGNVTIDGTGSSITISGSADAATNIGEDGIGTMTVTNGGTYSGSGEFNIGRNAGSSGTVTMSDAGSLMDLTNHMFVGRNGNGTFTQNDGTLNLNGRRMQIADTGTSTGVVNLNGGTVTNSEWIHVSSGVGANGTLNISYPAATDTLTTGALYVGNGGGTGLVNMANGTLNTTGVIEVGRIASGTGTLNIIGAGSTVNAYTGGALDGFVRIGTNSGKGTVNVSAGGKFNTNGGWLTLGDAEGGGQGATGVVTATGAGSTINTRGLIVGWNGSTTGTLNVLDGAVVNNTVHELSVGRDFNAGNNPTGIINISGGGILNAGPETRIGHNTTGIVNIDGGTLNMQGGGWAIIGDGGNATGTLNMSAGNVNVTADNFVLGQNAGAVGTYNQTGGATQVDKDFNVGRGGSTGTLNLDGGTFNVNGWTTLGRDGNGTGTINVRNGAAFTHLQNGGDMLVGWNNGSHGTINVESGGTVVQNWWTRVAVDPGSTGAITVDGAGSKFTVGAGRTYIGESGTGTLTVTNGGIFEHLNGGEQFNVGGNDGRNSSGVGVVNISDAGSKVTSASMFGFGRGQTGGIRSVGTLNISGGTVSTPGWIGFGQDGGSGVLNMTGGTITSGTEFHVGIDTNGFATQSIGVANMSEGTINVGTTLFVGRNGGNGTFNKTGGTINVTNSLEVGRDGTGKFTNAGGTTNVNGFYVGNGAGAVGTVDITDGTINNTGWVDIGGGGTGTVNVDGPNAKFLGSISDMQIGTGANGLGTVNVLNGGKMTHNWWINVGRGGGSVGHLRVEGTGSELTVGTRVDSNDSRLNVGADPNDPNNVQSGTLDITDGGLVARTSLGGELNVGRNVGSVGTVTIDTGGRFTNAGGVAFIGVNGGTGTMSIADAGSEFSIVGDLLVGLNGGSTGTLSQSGGTVAANNLRVGTNSANGTYNFAGGTLNVPFDMTVCWQGAAVGVMTIAGGVATVSTDTYVGVDGTAKGTLTFSGGTLNTGHLIVARDAGNEGTVQLNSGLLATNYITNGAGTAVVNFNGATVKARSNRTNFFEGFTAGNSEIQGGGLIFDSNGFNVSATNVFDGPGGLTKNGAGTLTLTAINTFTGETQVNGGILEVNGALSTGGVVTNVGATLSGFGIINGDLLSVGGKLSPGGNGGLDVGDLTINGGITLDNSSIFELTINDEAIGQLDRIVNVGAFENGGASLMVTFNDSTFISGTTAADLALATRYKVITGPMTATAWGNATLIAAGDLADLGLTGPQYEIVSGGQRFWLESGSLSLVPIAPIPEPSATILVGALFLLNLRRRRSI